MGKATLGIRAFLCKAESTRRQGRCSTPRFGLSDGPVERATDNESVVKGMHQKIFLDKCPRGSDEDLWKRAYGEVRRLGLGRVAVRWTKGHATREDSQAGRSTEEGTRGNDAADALATIAVDNRSLPKEIT